MLSTEVREMIWSFVVAAPRGDVGFSMDDTGKVKIWRPTWDITTTEFYIPELSLLLIDKQTSSEARKIFYSRNTLCFPRPKYEEPKDRNQTDSAGFWRNVLDHARSAATASRFFSSVSCHTLAFIRNVEFQADLTLMRWFDSYKSIMTVLRSDWVFICEKFANTCTGLRSLRLTVWYDSHDSYPHPLLYDEGGDPIDETPT